MRQYRGRIKDSTVWVYGYYTKSPQGIARIWSPITKDNGESYLYDYVVDPETVGQQTGLPILDGTNIYKDDVLQFTEYNDDGTPSKERRGVVEWNAEGAGFVVWDYENGDVFWLQDVLRYDNKAQIIGNIHDHPHLLKGEGQ